jgi:uncharacterized tellurite resistance protein B-like protein
MLRKLAELFDGAFGRTPPADGEEARRHAVQLATALLLIEVARADYREDLTEDAAVFGLLRQFFSLSEEEASLLVEQARSEADHAASLQSFTRDLHDRLTHEEKLRVIEMLWRVALADEHLDKHEDHLIRKIAGLFYVSHGDLIRLRNKVRGE